MLELTGEIDRLRQTDMQRQARIKEVEKQLRDLQGEVMLHFERDHGMEQWRRRTKWSDSVLDTERFHCSHCAWNSC